MTTRRGEVVFAAGPYWRVVRQNNQYVVVDISVDPPVQVSEPKSRADATAEARVLAHLWIATHGQGDWFGG